MVQGFVCRLASSSQVIPSKRESSLFERYLDSRFRGNDARCLRRFADETSDRVDPLSTWEPLSPAAISRSDAKPPITARPSADAFERLPHSHRTNARPLDKGDSQRGIPPPWEWVAATHPWQSLTLLRTFDAV